MAAHGDSAAGQTCVIGSELFRTVRLGSVPSGGDPTPRALGFYFCWVWCSAFFSFKISVVICLLVNEMDIGVFGIIFS